MFCPKCGMKGEADQRFCVACGTPLPAASSAEPVAIHSGTEGAQPTAPDAASQWSTPLPSYSQYAAESAPNDWASPGQLDAPALAPFGAVLSGWWRRVAAYLIDVLVLLIPYIIEYAIVRTAFGHNHLELVGGQELTVRTINGGGRVVEYVIGFVLGALYFVPLNGAGKGQTVGNRAVGIAIRDLQTGATIGLKRSLGRYTVRAVLYILFVVPGLLSDLFPLWDKKNQTLADKAVRSVVIRLR